MKLITVVLALTVIAPAFASGPVADVNVNVDMTPAGQKIIRPTPAKPAYYAPVVGGLHEEGDVAAGSPPPEQNAVLHAIAKVLAAEGYLVASAKTPKPDILLVFHWGSLNPDIMDTPEGPVLMNERQMTALVAGNTVGNLNPFSERQDILHAAMEDRYFVTVTAYDYAAAKQKKKIPLWRAKMSMSSRGVTLADAVPVLIASGGPMLGRETIRPVTVTKPLERQGTVNLGELKVEEYLPPASPPVEKPKQP